MTCLLCLCTSSIALENDAEDGSYQEDNSGQYIPDDSGRYIPDYSGQYQDDGTGRYSGDDAGRYAGNNFIQRKYSNVNNPISTNLLGDGEEFRKVRANQLVPKRTELDLNSIQKQLISRPASRAVPRFDERSGTSPDGRWRIIKQNAEVDIDGYSWEYETENGISAAESGKLANKGSQNEAMQASGFFQYTGPDNVLYSVRYRADENGFRPEGAHLPTPPPIPEAILRALESQTGSRRA
ncbi:hypothetical protein HHI36_006387 [Cryptolaemus montrouzieri]|uniref:Uncharacterized protein n=1 Tax=Cryptolaemus montrouzieri TaxID=559131 RepID=A0ABD2NXU0_9CUCU